MADNSEIIGLLDEFAQIADIMGETYRTNAYNTAVQSIKKLSWKIKENPQRVIQEKIPGVGIGIRNRLLEYIRTGTIADLEKLRKNKKVVAASAFSKIAGVGPATVRNWLSMRIYDMGQLRRKIGNGTIVLTKMQQYGLKYYDDLNTRIPRDEVEEIGSRVRRLVISLMPDIQMTIAGSYRRGASTSGDIDIIATSTEYEETLLKNVSLELENDPDFVAVMSSGSERLTFLYKYGMVRQVDILYLPKSEFYPGVLYFTGDWSFNEEMRRYARKKGYRLNQRGLYQLKPPKLIKVNSEKEIFDILGLSYVEPPARMSGAIKER